MESLHIDFLTFVVIDENGTNVLASDKLQSFLKIICLYES